MCVDRDCGYCANSETDRRLAARHHRPPSPFAVTDESVRAYQALLNSMDGYRREHADAAPPAFGGLRYDVLAIAAYQDKLRSLEGATCSPPSVSSPPSSVSSSPLPVSALPTDSTSASSEPAPQEREPKPSFVAQSDALTPPSATPAIGWNKQPAYDALAEMSGAANSAYRQDQPGPRSSPKFVRGEVIESVVPSRDQCGCVSCRAATRKEQS